ncbi:MAG: outer membrane protein assembly factor BamD [Alphaproteobacteria bacterium]|nr:outer membrane protein assembly factor BamD [Alphaproteobacteria bacterium]
MSRSAIGKCLRFALIGAAAAIGLAACDKTEKPYFERPAEDLYNDAMDSVLAGKYENANNLFQEVERQHPYSVWATKAQLMAAYASYVRGSYDDAVLALDRFIELHPGNRDVSYAYYLKALSYYEQISDVGRDQRMTERALAALEEVMRRFPDSKYSRDSRLKLDLVRDHLAGKEMEIGRYYLTRGYYLAAINRFRNVVDKYQTTTHVPEALHRLAEAYSALGIAPEARQSAAVLGHNFPGSDWYIDSYEMVEGKTVERPGAATDNEPGFFGRLWPF